MAVQLYNIILWVLNIYSYLLIARILMSWVPDIERTALGRVLSRITDPYLYLFRRFIPMLPLGGAYLDLSTIVAYLAWKFVVYGASIVLGWVLF